MAIALLKAGYHYPGASDPGVALCPVSLELQRGEQVAVIGPSGAGKTTLLHLVGTALRPSCGTLTLEGDNPWLLPQSKRQAIRRRIGLIQQAPPLPPRQRVITAVSAGRLGQWSTFRALLNLAYPLETEGVRACLTLLNIEDKMFERCDQLSGGQLQRIAIARTLYQRTRVILADEPVSAMDPLLARHTLEVLCAEARQQQSTLLVSLHAVDLALHHFDRVIGLRSGAIVFDKAAAEISHTMLAELYANDRFSSATSRYRSPPSAGSLPTGGYPCR